MTKRYGIKYEGNISYSNTLLINIYSETYGLHYLHRRDRRHFLNIHIVKFQVEGKDGMYLGRPNIYFNSTVTILK